MTIGYEGTLGSHSQDALTQLLASQPSFARSADDDQQGFPSIDKLLFAVSQGVLQYGLVPIENSIAGTFFAVADAIMANGLHIVGEYEHEELQVLAALPGVKLSQIKQVHSHPYAFDQCRPFLSSPPMANKILIQSADTAGSCSQIKELGLKESAAIASAKAAAHYGLEVITEVIASEASITRYVLVSKTPIIPERHTNPRTSIQVILKNQVGSIMKCVSCFALREISISKIESRPTSRSIKLQKAWEYQVFLDCDLGTADPRLQKALDNLSEFAQVRVLGSYPRFFLPVESISHSYGV